MEQDLPGSVQSICLLFSGENFRVAARGDDFTLLGRSADPDWLRGVARGSVDLKHADRLERNSRELCGDSRVVTGRGEAASEYEADQHHAEIIVMVMGIKPEREGVATPGLKQGADLGVQESEILDQRESLHRGVAARGNYFGQDRMDTQFVATEACRFWRALETCDWRGALRLGRCLQDRKRVFRGLQVPATSG